jgi:hypothetical protein
MNTPMVEWITINSSRAVVSRETSEFWFVELQNCGDVVPLTSPMTGPGSPGSTAGLLNGAVASGIGDYAGALKLCTTSLPKYIVDLVASYHNSRRTVGNYRKAATRFKTLGRADIATYLERHAREENGHERLALRDLTALGLPAERVVANLIPKGVAALCELFDSLSSSDYPIGCIGYSYFFESSAAKRQRSDIEALQALCPTGVDATRFMRAHSSLGSEVDHVKDMIAFIASLPASDRIEIVKAVYTTAMTVAEGVDLSGPNSDAAMCAQIRAAVGQDAVLAA